ncbi:MAG TPA: heparinase II/III family protein, partial [Sphingobacteriaceae bacterium]
NIPRVGVPERPFLYVNPDEIAAARNRAEKENQAKVIKNNYLKIADTWLKRDYDFVKKIIPAWGSIYTYGLGLNLDPVQQKKMKWRGWEDPRHVEAENGAIYPNDRFPDNGQGWTDSKSKGKYYFIALANGMTIHKLESVELPALVNSFVLTGNEAYAERALWILDAIATIYPRAYEGPIDYPHNEPGRPDGGRLDRPYYQAARALMNYAYFAEMLSMSKHAMKASPSNPRYTMIRNIELNMLMNGADYCLRMAQAGKGASLELNNGNIDYNRAPLVVGAMLGIPGWVDWALNGPLGFKNAISNTIDINGRYFETGTSYASHTRELLLSTAHFLRRMRLPDYPQGYGAFDDSRFALFALDFFSGIQVAGRLPLFGDAGPDAAIITDGSVFDKGTLIAAHSFYRYSQKKELQEAALQAGAQMLKDIPSDYKYSGTDLFNMYGWEEFVMAAKKSAINPVSSKRSTLFFDYGTLILRSGQKEKERAALIRFGPTLNHGQADELGLAFYAKGREFSFDPGYFNTHLRFGFTSSTVAHNLLVVNRRNQLRQPSPGGDLQTWTDGPVLRSASLNNPHAYGDQEIKEYKRRVALIDLSEDDSYIIDNFWAQGGRDYDYSLHGIKNGKLKILSPSETSLKETRAGSVKSPDVDYSSEMDPNGRVNSYADKPFYFAPPGDGFGFLSSPSFYALNGPARLQWSATDSTDHQMYVSHFAPASAQLITAHSPKAGKSMGLTYALSRVKVPVSETVRFTSVIQPTSGINKLEEVQQLLPVGDSKSAFALRLKPAAGVKSDIREHYYVVSDKPGGDNSFEGEFSFSGEEGFLGLNSAGKIVSASLTGQGYIQKRDFKFTVKPLFEEPLEILQVESQPLRVLVNIPFEKTRKLEGSIVRLTRPELIRPFVLRVNESKAAGNKSWLIMDASSNIHAVGVVNHYEQDTITTDAPFPHTRPYVFSYDANTGMPGGTTKNRDYNGGYNGFWLVSAKDVGNRTLIKNLEKKRTEIVLENTRHSFQAGDKFEIQLLAPGDFLEVPVWSQAKRNVNGTWEINGPAMVTITQ